MFLTPQTTPSSSAHSSFIGDAGKAAAYEAPAHDDLEFGLLAEDIPTGPAVDSEPPVPQLAGVWKHSHDVSAFS